jgi:hypothetical protein
LFDIYPNIKDSAIGFFLNSSVQNLQLELTARTYGGGGGPIKTQVYELSDMLALDRFDAVNFRSALSALTQQEALPIATLLKDTTRQALDIIVFDALGLTLGERDAVYEAVINLVEARLKKAESFNKKSSRKRIEEEED